MRLMPEVNRESFGFTCLTSEPCALGGCALKDLIDTRGGDFEQAQQASTYVNCIDLDTRTAQGTSKYALEAAAHLVEIETRDPELFAAAQQALETNDKCKSN